MKRARTAIPRVIRDFICYSFKFQNDLVRLIQTLKPFKSSLREHNKTTVLVLRNTKKFKEPKTLYMLSVQLIIYLTYKPVMSRKYLVLLSLVHTSDVSIKTRSKRKQSVISPQGLAKIKQQDFFFVSSFVRLMAYAWTMILCLWLRRSLCRRLDLITLFYLRFVLMFILMLTCEPDFIVHSLFPRVRHSLQEAMVIVILV